MRRRGWIVAVAALMPAGLRACDSCRNALADDPAALGFSRGIYASIVVMLAVLAALVALFIRMLMREAKQDRLKEASRLDPS